MFRVTFYIFIKSLEGIIVLLLFLLFFSTAAYSQKVSRVLISGLSGNTSHEIDVKNAFLIGYKSYDGTDYTGQIDLHVDINVYSALDYAHLNGYQIVVRSYTGLINAVNDSAEKYPDVLLFMPAGSNNFLYYCCLDIPNAVVVSTGAGVDTLATAYKVEFFSIDPITNNNESSFSNGFIAGQISYLANKLNIPPQQARIIARNNSSSNQSINYVQYGKINLVQAVQNTDSTLSLPVELTSFAASQSNNHVILNWTTSTEINNYGFEIQRSAISRQLSANALADSRKLNAESWTKIGFVNGSGNSNSPKKYSFLDSKAGSGIVEYRLKQIDNDGSIRYSNTIQLKINNPLSFELKQNYPNPFNPATTIEYSIPKAVRVKLEIFNLLGQPVKILENKFQSPGTYKVIFNASQMTSGVYFYVLQAGDFVSSKKLLLLK